MYYPSVFLESHKSDDFIEITDKTTTLPLNIYIKTVNIEEYKELKKRHYYEPDLLDNMNPEKDICISLSKLNLKNAFNLCIFMTFIEVLFSSIKSDISF